MKLTPYERLTTLAILPAESDFITLRIIRELKSKLSFSEEELKALAFKVDEKEGKVTANWTAIDPVDVSIGEKATDIIVAALKKLDKEQKLTDQHYSLYEKFVEDGGK